MVNSIFLIVIGGCGWAFATLAGWKYLRLKGVLRNKINGDDGGKYDTKSLIEKLSILTEAQFEGQTVNSLLRMCHSLLGASGIELATNPELHGDKNGTTSVRLTSGRPVTQNAQSLALRVGPLTIGQLRFDAAPLDRIQRLTLERIAQALSLQLIAQRTSRELRQMAGVEAQGERARTGFIASLSHELRGPLGMVLNAVELVRDELCGPINPDQRETLGLVHGNIRHLLSLVNDVLDFAKTESDTVVPKTESVSIKPLMEELVGSSRGQADMKNQKVSLEVRDDLFGLFDERHLRQIVLNLLTNAIKYTPKDGNISVRVSRTSDKIKISVKDSGVGIPAKELHKVFTPFERVSTGLSEQGTGLGMPLSKLLAEKNGGELSFVSTVGVGSEFTLTLPVTETRPQSEHSPVNSSVSLAGQSFLLASRDSDQLSILSRALGALDASVTALNAETWAHLKNQDALYDESNVTAVIIDSTAVTGSGDSAVDISSWVSFANNKKVPLVMLTPRAFESDTAEYLKSGVDVCLAKPFETSELALALQRLRSLQSQ